MWVGGVASAAGQDAVLAALKADAAPAPLSILRVAGRGPGLILQFMGPAQVPLLHFCPVYLCMLLPHCVKSCPLHCGWGRVRTAAVRMDSFKVQQTWCGCHRGVMAC